MYIVQSSDNNIKVVDHKFYEPGHSYNDCARNFGLIEKKKRLAENVWTTDKWCDLVKASSKALLSEE